MRPGRKVGRLNANCHWAIVGGGALGLTLALRLSAQGQRVTVLEASDRLGGLADAWSIGDVRWDRHYHVILPSDVALIRLLEEIGLGDAITWAKPRSTLFDGKQSHPLNNGLDYLRLPVLSFADKARLAATILYASRIRDGHRLEDIGVEDWLARLSGRRVFDTLWRPLLEAKLGENHVRASASFIWAIIRRMYSARAAGVARDRFGTVAGGYGAVFDRMKDVLVSRGVSVRTNAQVRAVRTDGTGWRIETGNVTSACDRIIVTTPPRRAADMLDVLSDDERNALRAIPYQGVICMSVLLRRPLDGPYMTYILDRSCPLTTVINMTAVTGVDAFAGRTLCYLPAYVPSDSPMFGEEDTAIEHHFLGGLRQIHPEISSSDIEAVRISRARHVLPIPIKGYSRRLPPHATSRPGLYLVNSAHIVNGTLNINETVELADRALAAIASEPAGDGAIERSATAEDVDA